MTDIALAFITGLTTGGLSCMAVQGGLLAASVAQGVERDIAAKGASAEPSPSKSAAKAKGRRVTTIPFSTEAAQPPAQSLSLPIILFLVAKVTAYTFLGFILGALGTVLQLTPMTRAIVQIGIGVFLVGNALRMLNVHPIFRYFNFEPPKAVTRYLRRSAKEHNDLLTPLFLGFLTVLIPCGITQAMMAVAIGTANPMQGAAIMFAFTLGTTPVFFALAYAATRLGSRLEHRFTLLAATVLLVLGVVSVMSGMALAGRPISLPTTAKAAVPATAQPATSAPADAVQTLTINARANGYQPALVSARAGVPAKLALVTNKTYSCSRAFVIPSLNIQKMLPESGTVTVDIPAQKAGTTLNFTCSMGMYTGSIRFN